MAKRQRIRDLPAVVPASLPDGRLARQVAAELERHQRLDTWTGATALALARRIESPHETGSAVAAMSRELSVVMARALAGAQQPQPDLLDELAARRDAPRAARRPPSR